MGNNILIFSLEVIKNLFLKLRINSVKIKFSNIIIFMEIKKNYIKIKN